MDNKTRNELLEKSGIDHTKFQDVIQNPLLSKAKREELSQKTGKKIKSGGKTLIEVQDDFNKKLDKEKQQESVLE